MAKIIDKSLLQNLTRAAQRSPRQRSNHNIHPDLADPIQRFLNAIEPESYIRPHRHSGEGRWELFSILSGAVLILILDEQGVVLDRVELDANGGNRVIEIPSGVWHTLAALAPETVLLELKPGPYAALTDKDFASWAPVEGDSAAALLLSRYKHVSVGDCLAR